MLVAWKMSPVFVRDESGMVKYVVFDLDYPRAYFSVRFCSH